MASKIERALPLRGHTAAVRGQHLRDFLDELLLRLPEFRPTAAWKLAWCVVSVIGSSGCNITGTSIDSYVTATGTVTRPTPGTRYKSILASGSKSSTSSTGTLSGEGDVFIPNVPEGEYALELAQPPPPVPTTGALAFTQVLSESARTLDLGTPYSCRPGLIPITQPTQLVINASLTVPWQTYTTDSTGTNQQNDDSLQFFSSGADVNGSIYADASVNGVTPAGAPATGATALSGWTFNVLPYWFGVSTPGSQPHLVDGSQGDTLTILHNVQAEVINDMDPNPNDPWTGYRYDATQEAFQPASFTMTQGGTTVLSGSFTALPMKTFNFTYGGSAFNDLLSDAPVVDVYSGSVAFSLYHEPGSPLPGVGADVTLLEFYVPGNVVPEFPECASAGCNPAMCPTGCATGPLYYPPGTYMSSFSYGDPFTTGQELASVTWSFTHDVTSQLMNPSNATEILDGYVVMTDSAKHMGSMVLQPPVGLPKNIQVNGMTMSTSQISSGVGTRPTITFEAPSLGRPTYYFVGVINVDAVTAADGDVTSSQYIASVFTTSTTVTVPAGLMETGSHYYFQVGAVLDPTFDPSRPNKTTETSTSAVSFTGLVTP